MKEGALVISLDFELHWGSFDRGGPGRDLTYLLRTRSVVPEILATFEKHGIHATWATVGLLFHRSRKEAVANFPALRPTYQRTELSAYRYIEEIGIGEDEASDPHHFAPSLIERILRTPHQEVGSHTFAHYYCHEEGQTPQQFEEDLRAAKRAASLHGVALESLVLPRNQFDDHYMPICAREGFRCVRTNPERWFWKLGGGRPQRAVRRLFRGIDGYLPLSEPATYPLRAIAAEPSSMPLRIPASRFLRPQRPTGHMLNWLSLSRAKREMTWAARNSHIYHLWWHPHNFGAAPERNLAALEELCRHYRRCFDELGMRSMNMGEIASAVLEARFRDS